MRCVCWILVLLVFFTTDVVCADETPRRTTRIASGPVRAARTEQPQDDPSQVRPAPKSSAVPTVDRPDPAQPTLLEPSFQLEGVGRGMVGCFQVQAEQAAVWRLVVQEIDGPVAQIFEGQGPPPLRIPWDGRLLGGGLAWSGVTYTYDLAFVDSSGTAGEVAGAPFTLPSYSREERDGISHLVFGHRLTAGLKSVAEQLNREGRPTPVRIEVLARDDFTARALGETVRVAIADLLEPGGRTVDLYIGTATAAPAGGTVLITTVPLAAPAVHLDQSVHGEPGYP